MELNGRTVLLTGASTGLGPHIARRLHREGAKFVLSARNEEAMRKLADELGGAKVIPADLSRAGEPERLAHEAGDVDVLVSNAGLPASGRLETFSVEAIDNALTVNVRAGIVLARLLAPSMVARKSGHLVFMSSIAGKLPTPGLTIYNATKFAVRGFGLSLREELWGTGVGVSVICPVYVSEAGMWAATGLKPHPIVGEVTPAQVADAVLSAITKNRREVDVAGLGMKASLVVQALAPGIVAAAGRRPAASIADAQGERQRDKR
ncbi:MAG TPA: SDR family NAD(P)-dependent oxidoreductase [Candidatus Dormibacteraeota bacterium]|nr:SDR family NAD(P)-dependent oxidoreductase [Candidatus Dormibacteraeota bacterium]